MRNGRASLRNTDRESWLLRINGRDVRARPHRLGPGAFRVSMDQRTPTFGPTADTAQTERAVAAFLLTAANLAPDLAPDLAPAVVSTGVSLRRHKPG
jgi:hypothetical protein